MNQSLGKGHRKVRKHVWNFIKRKFPQYLLASNNYMHLLLMSSKAVHCIFRSHCRLTFVTINTNSTKNKGQKDFLYKIKGLRGGSNKVLKILIHNKVFKTLILNSIKISNIS